MEFLSAYGAVDLFWIGLSLFLVGMGKGGFPVGAVALPILILAWPAQANSARAAVGFMLPMLVLMDVVAVIFYRGQILWDRLARLMPATILGVVVASVLFVSDSARIAVSDGALKFLIGLLGIVFVVYFAIKKWILGHIHESRPTWGKSSVFGFAAGMVSTLAHSAGPVLQMYLLPQRLEKNSLRGRPRRFSWC